MILGRKESYFRKEESEGEEKTKLYRIKSLYIDMSLYQIYMKAKLDIKW